MVHFSSTTQGYFCNVPIKRKMRQKQSEPEVPCFDGGRRGGHGAVTGASVSE